MTFAVTVASRGDHAQRWTAVPNPDVRQPIKNHRCGRAQCPGRSAVIHSLPSGIKRCGEFVAKNVVTWRIRLTCAMNIHRTSLGGKAIPPRLREEGVGQCKKDISSEVLAHTAVAITHVFFGQAAIVGY
ncbi:hypothetical protein CDAR_12001 [Caerostris darwini]|uniref:Uncharacterized protein n=1 Tax=Caerostris darwini TaxID=1538125 RepID=A0AAV4M4V7_9ARAC|nr:hypothetical protein CDAR_12001 [Caerostris darwini]